MFATSFYLNHTQGNLLRQLCLTSIEAVSDGARPIPQLGQLGMPRKFRRRGACNYQGTRYERGLMIKTYSLGPYDLEYEIDSWSFFRSEVERLRAAYITGPNKQKRLRLKISLGPTQASLVPDHLEQTQN
ncbi:MAG: hypothetical protein AAGF81_13555 [Pseudomonadota bacterium]